MGCLSGRLPKHNGQITHKLKALTAALLTIFYLLVFFFNKMAHKLDMHNIRLRAKFWEQRITCK